MRKILFILAGCFLCIGSAVGGAWVLVVADEIPAMEFLAGRLEVEEKIGSEIVTQGRMPADLSGFAAVIVYIHGKLEEDAERVLIAYTKAGGKLIVLHHSISSGKRKNREWFGFLGVSLPEGEFSQGGYKWIEPVALDIVNLAPDHFITSNRVTYPIRVPYRRSDLSGSEELRPGFSLQESEVYLNHMLTQPRTVLLGFRYVDAKSGQVYMQDRAGWLRSAGRGLIIYLLPGHSVLDFQNRVYARLIINAVLFQP
jgi:hypothetical protein